MNVATKPAFSAAFGPEEEESFTDAKEFPGLGGLASDVFDSSEGSEEAFESDDGEEAIDQLLTSRSAGFLQGFTTAIPPVKGSDASNINIDHLRDTRLYGWSGCDDPHFYQT
ncbi:uncharacterized protein PG986_014005 [Apiospora aurea]|uniref:Clathrin light chain n=1 Tax=Apiospora aurea TaxID=335848 RepID=A0ABR1PXI5_9PEZI